MTAIQAGYLVRQENISGYCNIRPSWKAFGMIQMLGLVSILSGCALPEPSPPPLNVLPDPQMAASMSLGEAKAIIQHGTRWYSADGDVSRTQLGVEFTPEKLVMLQYIPDKTKIKYRGCPTYEMSDPYIGDSVTLGSGPHKGITPYNVNLAPDGSCAFAIPTMEEAQQVAAAFLRWKNSTLAERKAYLGGWEQRFSPIAKRYRATYPAPTIPEEVRRFRIIAESAEQDNRFADAADAYLDGLKVAPWWPGGQYNAALILARLHYYDEAIEHMQHYLALVPQAPDARAAQDMIYQWQGEEASVQ